MYNLALTPSTMHCDTGWVYDCNACHSATESPVTLIPSYYNVANTYAIKIDGKCLKYDGSGNMVQLDTCDNTNVNLLWTFTLQTSQSNPGYMITSYAVSPSTPRYLYSEDNANCWLYAESSYSNINNVLWNDASFASIITVAPTTTPTKVPSFKPTVKPTSSPTKIPTIKPTLIPTYISTLAPAKISTLSPTKAPTIDGLQGFTITGTATNTKSGFSVSGAGDLNGDGYQDIIIGAPSTNSNAGTSYVIYGGNNLAAMTLPPSSSQGFAISGTGNGAQSGFSVSSAGDINGDGYDDIIVGVPGSGGNNGAAIIYGGAANPGSIDLLNFVQGFSITAGYGAYSGYSVSNAGDVNKDGYDDVIIGVPGSGGSNGAVVIYGNSINPGDIDLRDLTAQQGFFINGAKDGDYSGRSVSNAGDINKDGYADVLIGAPDINTAYLVYGSFSPNEIYLNSLSSQQGFSIIGVSGSYTGCSLSGIGDTNGDGYADFIIGAKGTNMAYVVYGKSTFSNINLGAFTSSQGFYITGSGGVGFSVSGAGDINNDGYADVIVGAPNLATSAGFACVVYGSSYPSNVNLNSLSSAQGFCLTGDSHNQLGYSVSDTGDVNKDGFVDIILGAPYTNNEQGESYLLYGASSFTPIPESDGNADNTDNQGYNYDAIIGGAVGGAVLLGGVTACAIYAYSHSLWPFAGENEPLSKMSEMA